MTFMGFRCPALGAVGTARQPNWTEAEADACRGKWTAGSSLGRLWKPLACDGSRPPHNCSADGEGLS